MQATARKVSSDDLSQDNLTNKSTSVSPHEQSKLASIDSKAITSKTTKENDLSRLLAAYGDCV